MGFNFRKSIKLGGGLRLNVSKKGVGLSAGGKGFRVGVGPRGTRVTASIPGTGISYSTSLGSSRKTSRAAAQRRRELLAQQREQEKMLELQRAQYEVDLFENQIDVITSVHKDCTEEYDWQSIKDSLPPFEMGEVGPYEKQAIANLETFKPSWRDRLFNRVEIRKQGLYEEIEKAKQRDKEAYREWELLKESATKVLNGDVNTYLEIIREFAPFEEISELGSSIQVSANHPKYIEATVFVHSNNVIPNEEKTLTKTGKLSVKQMSKTRFNELYQDYVCSCAIHVARELFALLPVEKVYVHAIGEVLNTKNGQTEEGPILSVVFPRNLFSEINFDKIDCSDCIQNFSHNMSFKKTKGFEVVEKIVPTI